VKLKSTVDGVCIAVPESSLLQEVVAKDAFIEKGNGEKLNGKAGEAQMKSINFEEMLDRMLSGLRLSSVAELARLFNVSAQALSNARQRSSMPLSYLLKYLSVYEDKTGASTTLDWIVFGVSAETVAITSLSGVDTDPAIRFDVSWLTHINPAPDNLRYIIAEQSMSCFNGDTLLVDTADRTVRDGVFVFMVNGRQVVKGVKIRIDGIFLIDGEEISTGVISSLDCLGRVIWKGSTSVSPV